jgi:hypothetical protein
MNALTLFGLFAVTAMLITYALEARSHWFILAFAGSRGRAVLTYGRPGVAGSRGLAGMGQA